jgi:hypothetical protein
MADEQYRWLDRETAERLLRGESLEAVDAADRDQAERLAKTLESLTVEPPLSSAELPGEAAALAAFRAARADRDDVAMTVGHRSGSPASHRADGGLVRIGTPTRTAPRPGRGRPLRLALAAALAVGMIGGVAVAVGTGALPTPFSGDEPARPAATVSAPVPPESPLFSPSPRSTARERVEPDGTSKAPTGPGSGQDAAPGAGATDRDSAGEGREGASGRWWQTLASSCRDVRGGKQLSLDRRRDLESAAGGSERVRKYCTKVLDLALGGAESERGKDRDRDNPDGRDKNGDRNKDEDDSGDRGHHGHNGHHGSGRHGDGRGEGDSDRGHRAAGAATTSVTVVGVTL